MSKLCNIKRIGSNSIEKKGFTLVEILIVIGIMVLTSGMFIGYNRSGDEQIVLFKDQAMFIGAINRVKAFTQERFNIAGACAFGIYIPTVASGNTNPPRKFFIFVDKAPVGQECITVAYDGIETPNTGYYYNNPPDEIIETLELDKRMKFIAEADSRIMFLPPDLKIYPPNETFTATIGSVSSERQATIEISSGGQITTR